MTKVTVPLHTPLFRGERRLRIALVGMLNAGKSTLFSAVSSTAPRTRPPVRDRSRRASISATVRNT